MKKVLFLTVILVSLLLVSGVKANLVAEYTMAYGNVTDASGNAHPIQIIGDVTPALDGYGLLFNQDAQTSYLNITDSSTPSAFDGVGSYTFSAWVKLDSCNEMGFIGKGGNNFYENKAEYAFLVSGGQFYMATGRLSPCSSSGVTDICNGSWHHVANVWDVGSQRRDTYIDGVKVGTSSCSGWNVGTTLSSTLIGAYEWLGNTYSMNGTMYDVQFYDDSKDDTWVSDQYALGMPSLPPVTPTTIPLGASGQILSDVGTGVGALFDGLGLPLASFVILLALAGMVGFTLYNIANSRRFSI